MIMYRRITCFALMLFITSILLRGQTQADSIRLSDSLTTPENLSDTIDIETDANNIRAAYIIPILGELIDSALLHSPLLHAKSAEVEQMLYDLRMARLSWSDCIFLEASSRYGIFNQISLSEYTGSGDDQYGLKMANEQLNYYIGMSLKLPISSILNRRNEIRFREYSKAQSEYEMEQLKLEIKRLIIDAYYQLVSYEESMLAFQEVYQTMNISYMKAIRDVENGVLPLDEFALLVSTYGKSKEAFLKAKNNFYMQYRTLQVICGYNF